MTLRALALASVLLLWSRPACADDDHLPGVHDFSVGIEAGRVRDPAELGAAATIALAVDIHERLGLTRTGFAWAFDTDLGSTSSGGFLYGASIRIGPGLRIGDLGHFSVTTGVGFGGITGGRLGFALTIPTDAYLSVPLPHSIRFLCGATGTSVFTENPRQRGAAHFPPMDEFTAHVGISRPTWGIHAFISELHHTQILGLALVLADNGLEPAPP